MKLLIDMNLSPAWVEIFATRGIHSIHWSSVGKPNAKDTEIFTYAAENEFVIFTHDLDFGALLARAGARRPSVIQARVENVAPASLAPIIFATLDQFADQLDDGALVTILPERAKVRILPI